MRGRILRGSSRSRIQTDYASHECRAAFFEQCKKAGMDVRRRSEPQPVALPAAPSAAAATAASNPASSETEKAQQQEKTDNNEDSSRCVARLFALHSHLNILASLLRSQESTWKTLPNFSFRAIFKEGT